MVAILATSSNTDEMAAASTQTMTVVNVAHLHLMDGTEKGEEEEELVSVLVVLVRNHRKERRKRVTMVIRNITKMLVGGVLGGGDGVVGVGVNTPAQSNSCTREGAGGLYTSSRA